MKKEIVQSLCCRNGDLNGLGEQRPLLKYVWFPLIHGQIHATLDLKNELENKEFSFLQMHSYRKSRFHSSKHEATKSNLVVSSYMPRKDVSSLTPIHSASLHSEIFTENWLCSWHHTRERLYNDESDFLHSSVFSFQSRGHSFSSSPHHFLSGILSPVS